MDTFAGNNEDPLSLHKYLYCQGNPVDNADPSGHDIGEALAAMDISSTLAGIFSPVTSRIAATMAPVYFKFQVVTGHPFPFSLASTWGALTAGVGPMGKWGQPDWPFHKAKGDYAISGDAAFSTVTITSGPSYGTCNTVDYPDPSGTIKLYLRSDSPGIFHVSIYDITELSGTGPHGGALGELKGGGKVLLNAKGLTTSRFMESKTFDFDANVGSTWTSVATYTPTIGMPPDFGIQSTSTAYGFIQLLSATK